MKKRIISLVLILCILICTIPTLAFADSIQSTNTAPTNVVYVFRGKNGVQYDVHACDYTGLNYSNMTGHVIIIQYILCRAAYEFNDSSFYPTGGIDGIFGYGTQTALINLQTWWGLSADGVAGPETWSQFHAGYRGLDRPYINDLLTGRILPNVDDSQRIF